ncbi:MAG: hypothetical protein ACE366_13220 [Bradymonadia bacterium]
MIPDTLIVVCVLSVGGIALTWGMSLLWRCLGLLGGILCAVWVGIAFFTFDPSTRDLNPLPGAEHQPLSATQSPAPEEVYTSSRACRACHPEAYATWRRTYHRTMTQRASEEAIIPEWTGTLEDRGRTYRLFKERGGFWVDMPAYGTNGTRPEDRITRPIVMTTGSHQMQIYWVPAPWAETEASEAEGEAYRRHCGRCHVSSEHQALVAAPAWDLDNQGLQADDINDIWTMKAHRRAFGDISEDDKALALRHLKRGQLEGPLTQFPFSWFVREKRWVHEEYTFLQPPEDDYRGEPYGEDWSNRCDQCHSVSPRFDEQLDVGSMTVGQAEVAELGIACEACHGPGAAHVARHRDPTERYLEHLGLRGEDEKPDIVNPADLSPERSMAVCGQCHAELVYHGDWSQPETARFRPGDRLELYANVLYYEPKPDQRPDWLANAIRDEPDLLQSAFWKDGTMRIAGRDLNGIAISPCATAGEMSCLSCHAMHGHSDPEDMLAPKMHTDDACTQCHPVVAQNIEGHTHHGADSTGSRCYNCHMPHTTFGLLKAIRAHRIDSPNAGVSAETGRPTACNLCHLDKTLGEVADHLADWYGHPIPPMTDDQRDVAQSALQLLKGNAVQRGIMAWHMAWPPAQAVSDPWWFGPYLAQLVDDPYVAVRFLAIEALQTLPGYADFEADFTGSDDARAEAAREALRRWQAPAGANAPHVMIQNGRYVREALLRLLSQRDESPISINE